MQFAPALAKSPGGLAVPAGHLVYRMGCRTYRPVYICVLGVSPWTRVGGEGLDSRLRGNDVRAAGMTKVGEDGQ